MRDVKKALERLEKSSTQLTRRNARRALKSALDRIWREADGKYPGMNKDGSERVRATSPRCPICGIPGKTWIGIAKHVASKHRKLQAINRVNQNSGSVSRVTAIICWCGKGFVSIKTFAKHLQHLAQSDELRGHPAIEALQNL